MLFVGRFENDDDNASLLEQFRDPAQIGVRHSNERYGVERIEVTMRGFGAYDAFQRYRDHHGQRLAIYSPRMTRPISGWITAVEWLGGNLIKYVAKGPVERLRDKPDTTAYTAAQTVTQALTNILSNYITIDDGATTHIATNSTLLQGWQPNLPEGGYPVDEISELLAKSDSSSRIYDFLLMDQPMRGTALRKFTASFAYREDNAGPDWIVSRNDLRAAPELTRSIDAFTTTARVWYGLIQGTATGGSDTTLTDTTKNFIIGGVQPGDRVTNITVGGSAKVTAVVANTLTLEGTAYLRGKATGGSTATLIDTEVNFITEGVVVGDVVYNDVDDSRGVVASISTTTSTNDTLNISGVMSGGKQNDAGERYRVVRAFIAGHAYSIRTSAQTKYQEATTATTPYWQRIISEFESSMNATQAAQIAAILANTTPQQTQSISIGSKYIMDKNGALWPLPEVIARGGGYIQIPDLFPRSALRATSRDQLTTFKISAMNYDNTRNVLSCSLDTPDNRLDSRLRRANIISSEMVMRT